MAAHLTAAQVAERWHVTTPWVRTLAQAKSIPGAMKLGAHWRFPLAAIEAYERRHTVLDPLSMTDRAAARGRSTR